jgi:hypothetical protein
MPKTKDEKKSERNFIVSIGPRHAEIWAETVRRENDGVMVRALSVHGAQRSDSCSQSGTQAILSDCQ